MERSSVSVALDLLSLGSSGEDAAESTEKAKERLLTASILQSKASLWRHKVEDHHSMAIYQLKLLYSISLTNFKCIREKFYFNNKGH